ncbi:hypothetical protein BW99_09500 [Escherichia coli O157:H7 str. 08-3527]|uniref:Uncharacterized protein n=1 Tax=Escherichia phage Stx2 II TaxID=194949 RepID=Q7Y2S0_9CAUD|nr:hypothetical protein Stx1_p062 [Escherichia Stx1 converting phage]NP_859306.1 hypothetical protein Stx2II_p061 [Escherichia phage Stx2 II]EYV63384.1 hypothetical protein BX36_12435 [Escherichia coli O157:H7 str. 2009EL2109]EYV78009.1 hypothetical protein BY91_17125 [Escherichia coli O157:H7 str. K5806]EYW76112.1 hypothetical protein BY19_01520 [Escherichia coli O157:H7 str. 2011EL-2099]EYW97332.1 hypothetical protein BX01_12415 [Escherichia coli O157:H7 str. 08-4169]EYX03741.1 hypothetical
MTCRVVQRFSMRCAQNRTGQRMLKWRHVPLSVMFRIRRVWLAWRMIIWSISVRHLSTTQITPTLIRRMRNWMAVFVRHSITCSAP